MAERIAVIMLVSNLFKVASQCKTRHSWRPEKIRSTDKNLDAIQRDGIEMSVMLI